ncbi:MAG: hypothetical protein K2I40_06205 [Bifidobacterium castoris]|nr:hypothetical protein [Bifidobacterium castoris]
MVRNEELPETGKVTRQIAAAIRARMSERGLTQADVGDAIGRAQSYASLRIKGMKPWNVDELEILAPLLGYDNIFTLINGARASASALPRASLASSSFGSVSSIQSFTGDVDDLLDGQELAAKEGDAHAEQREYGQDV